VHRDESDIGTIVFKVVKTFSVFLIYSLLSFYAALKQPMHICVYYVCLKAWYAHDTSNYCPHSQKRQPVQRSIYGGH